MAQSVRYADLSAGIIKTVVTGDLLPTADAHRAASDVYDEFSKDAPIQRHIMELVAHLHGVSHKGPAESDLFALRRFDYLSREQLDIQYLRIKGIVALNMVETELYDGDLSASLVEPFVGRELLPELYISWREARLRNSSAS